jgi:hypothetical protein
MAAITGAGRHIQMTVELMTLGALASSVLSGVGYVVWRLYRSISRAPGTNPLQLAETYVRGQADATRERERRATIVATVAALPPGAILVDRRADGATLTIRMPVGSAASIQPGTMEPRRVR